MSWKDLAPPTWATDSWTLGDDAQPYILGAGAIGMAVACALVESGSRPILVSGWEDHVREMNENGIHLTYSDGNEGTFDVDAISEAEFASLRNVRLCYLTVKSQATAHFASLLAESLAPDGSVVSLQNGLNEATLLDVLGHERVVGGVAPIGAQRTGPGAVTVSGPQRTLVVGELNGDVTARVQAIAALTTNETWKTSVVSDIEGTLWSKLLNNTRLNSLCVLSGLALGPTMADPWYRSVALAIVEEVGQVADTLGVELVEVPTIDNPALLRAARNDAAEADRMLLAHAEKFAYVKPSTLQDIEAGRPTEIADLSGAVVRAAAKVGMLVPTIERVTHAASEIDRRGVEAREELVGNLRDELAEILG